VVVIEGWTLAAVLVLFFAGLVLLGAAVVLLWDLNNRLTDLMGDDLPRIEGFTSLEVGSLLAHAARLEFPQTKDDRRKPFSRRNMSYWVGRDRFETFRDALVERGYLEPANERETNQWTAAGRALLMKTLAGSFGPIVHVTYRKPVHIDNDQRTGYEIVKGKLSIE
jgi:hypothetical protein